MYRPDRIACCSLFYSMALCLPLQALEGTSEVAGTEGLRSAPLVFTSVQSYGGSTKEIAPLEVQHGQLLVTVGNTIYMLGREGKVLWQHSTGPNAPLTAQPVYRSDRNEVALIGADLTFQRLNGTTGALLWTANVSGAGSYTDLRPYRGGYLVLTNMTAYRERAIAIGEKGPPILDILDYWDVENDDRDWSVPFPIGAKLAIVGQRIYAVVYKANTVILDEIDR